MSFIRPVVFWVGVLAAVLAVVVLLREVLLPFVAGMVLAYLLDPLAARIERLGMNRLLATLAIIAFAVITITVLLVLTLPVIIRELVHFIESFPLYVKRLHELAADPSRPWLSKIIEEGQGEAERSLGELASLASNRPSITLATLEFATAARSGLPFVEPDLFMPPPRFSV
jgi:predicted PurR-regulated permease PerM